MRSFVAALQFLTIFPWPRRSERSAAELGPSAVCFPLIGFLLGVVAAIVHGLLQPFARPGLSSVALVALLAMLTRGLHLDGLADTFDGLGAGGDRERMLAIMDDSRTGAFGVTAIVLVLFCKVHALASIGDERWRALVCALVLSRWTMVLLAYRSLAAKEGLGSLWIGQMEAKHLLFATALALVLVAAVSQALGVAMMLWMAVLTTAWKRYLHRRLGGVTGDTFGALAELGEASVLFLLALVPAK